MKKVLAALLTVVDRPRTTNYGLLSIVVSLFVAQFILLIGSRSVLHLHGLPLGLSVICAILAIVVTLNLPMRTKSPSASEIAPPFAEPTNTLWSPEDRLTLWQFMTVSWMWPLIARGKNQQLNDDDVWQLGFEFKHRILHDNFRELHGSVIRRLLNANGLDLIITTILAIVESVASQFKWTPSLGHC